jgi:hypothetical protein
MVLLEIVSQHKLELHSTKFTARWICPSVIFLYFKTFSAGCYDWFVSIHEAEYLVHTAFLKNWFIFLTLCYPFYRIYLFQNLHRNRLPARCGIKGRRNGTEPEVDSTVKGFPSAFCIHLLQIYAAFEKPSIIPYHSVYIFKSYFSNLLPSYLLKRKITFIVFSRSLILIVFFWAWNLWNVLS